MVEVKDQSNKSVMHIGLAMELLQALAFSQYLYSSFCGKHCFLAVNHLNTYPNFKTSRHLNAQSLAGISMILSAEHDFLENYIFFSCFFGKYV